MIPSNLGAKIVKIPVYVLPFTNGLSKLSKKRIAKGFGFVVSTYTAML